MKLEFFIPTQPIPKGRPRFDTVRQRTYTDAKTEAYEKLVGEHAALRMRQARLQPAAGDVRVEAVFHLPDRRRRDLDNLVKALTDGMNKLVYLDDSQIMEIHAIMRPRSNKVGTFCRVIWL